MYLITSLMHLPPFPVHCLKVSCGFCCLAAILSVLLIGFMSEKVGIQCWSELLALFAILMVGIDYIF